MSSVRDQTSTDSTETWRISDKKYEQSELHQMWGTCSCRITTVCWLSMVLRTQNREFILDCNKGFVPIKSRTKKEIIHSEVLALREIENKIGDQLALYSGNSSVFDFCCWITNSPCNDCQEFILEKMKFIQSRLPNSFLRLIIFFSNLYRDPKNFDKNSDEEQKTDEALEHLKNWFLKLAEQKISILFGSIIVSQLVPKPEIVKDDKIPRLLLRKKRDLHSIVYFRKMLRKIKPRLSMVKFSCDYSKVFSDLPIDENILDEISPTNFPYISIYPLEFPLLSELTPLIEFALLERSLSKDQQL